MSTKFSQPENIDKLAGLFYNNPNPDSLNSYQKFLNNPDASHSNLNLSEDFTKGLFSKIGAVEKIPETIRKTPDFKCLCRDTALFLETKSINISYGKKIVESNIAINLKTEEEWINKINSTLVDMDSKFSDINGFRIGVIVLDIVFIGLRNCDFLWEKEFIQKTNFNLAKIDALCISHRPVGGNIQNKKPIVLVKNNELFRLLSEKFNPEEVMVVD